MEKRYSALRTVASILKGLGIFVGVITALIVIAMCLILVVGGAAVDDFSRDFGGTSGIGPLTGIFFALVLSIVPIIYGGGFALILYAFGEAINVQIDIEENTRSMVWMLRGANPIQPAPAVNIPPPQASQAAPVTSFAETKTSKQFCPNCGTKVTEADETCPNCEFELR